MSTKAAQRPATAGEMSSSAVAPTVPVWDVAVRVFHWSLVTVFVAAFLSGDEWDRFHELAGYTAAALVSFRIVWGFIGTRYARFSSFVTGPGTFLAYMRDMRAGKEKRYLGHNPAGAAMILALLSGVIALAVTGYMMSLDAYWGAKWLEEVHETIANGMLVLIALHVGGVVLASLRHGENLVRAMITGRKRVSD